MESIITSNISNPETRQVGAVRSKYSWGCLVFLQNFGFSDKKMIHHFFFVEKIENLLEVQYTQSEKVIRSNNFGICLCKLFSIHVRGVSQKNSERRFEIFSNVNTFFSCSWSLILAMKLMGTLKF